MEHHRGPGHRPQRHPPDDKSRRKGRERLGAHPTQPQAVLSPTLACPICSSCPIAESRGPWYEQREESVWHNSMGLLVPLPPDCLLHRSWESRKAWGCRAEGRTLWLLFWFRYKHCSFIGKMGPSLAWESEDLGPVLALPPTWHMAVGKAWLSPDHVLICKPWGSD